MCEACAGGGEAVKARGAAAGGRTDRARSRRRDEQRNELTDALPTVSVRGRVGCWSGWKHSEPHRIVVFITMKITDEWILGRW